MAQFIIGLKYINYLLLYPEYISDSILLHFSTGLNEETFILEILSFRCSMYCLFLSKISKK